MPDCWRSACAASGCRTAPSTGVSSSSRPASAPSFVRNEPVLRDAAGARDHRRRARERPAPGRRRDRVCGGRTHFPGRRADVPSAEPRGGGCHAGVPLVRGGQQCLDQALGRAPPSLHAHRPADDLRVRGALRRVVGVGRSEPRALDRGSGRVDCLPRPGGIGGGLRHLLFVAQARAGQYAGVRRLHVPGGRARPRLFPARGDPRTAGAHWCRDRRRRDCGGHGVAAR